MRVAASCDAEILSYIQGIFKKIIFFIAIFHIGYSSDIISDRNGL